MKNKKSGLIVSGGRARTEVERQELIGDLLRLRAAGLNVDRQERILFELRVEFELGWPMPSAVRGELREVQA